MIRFKLPHSFLPYLLSTERESIGIQCCLDNIFHLNLTKKKATTKVHSHKLTHTYAHTYNKRVKLFFSLIERWYQTKKDDWAHEHEVMTTTTTTQRIPIEGANTAKIHQKIIVTKQNKREKRKKSIKLEA